MTTVLPPRTPVPPSRLIAARSRSSLLALVTFLVLALLTATPASAFWTSLGAGTGSASAGTLGAPFGVTVPTYSLSTVTVGWTASTGSPAPTGYFVTRTNGGATAAACGTSATLPTTGTSCTDTAVADGSYTYKVIAQFRSWTAASTSSDTVTVMTPNKVAFTGQPSATIAGALITPGVQVTVQTNGGTTVPLAGQSVTVAITTPAGATLSGTKTLSTNTSGIATFAGLSIDKATSYTLTATSPGLNPATSATFLVTHAAASKFLLTPTAVTATASATPNLGLVTVQRLDAYDNPVTTGTTTLALSSSSGGASFSPSTSPTFSTGLSTTTFNYGDTVKGTPVITVATTGFSAILNVTINAGTPNNIVFGQQPPLTIPLGQVMVPSVAIWIQDQYGNLVTTTTTVTMSIAHNGGLLGLGSIGGEGPITPVGGIALFPGLKINGISVFGLGLVGQGSGYKIRATYGSGAGTLTVDSQAFTVT